jgi:hypothetical protein
LRGYGVKYGYPNIIGWIIDAPCHEHHEHYEHREHRGMIAKEYLRGKYGYQGNIFISVYDDAIYNGHLEMVKWAYEMGTRPHDKDLKYLIPNIVKVATYYSRVTILQWACEIDPGSINLEQIIIYAIRNAHFETFVWCITKGYICEYRA